MNQNHIHSCNKKQTDKQKELLMSTEDKPINLVKGQRKL